MVKKSPNWVLGLFPFHMAQMTCKWELQTFFANRGDPPRTINKPQSSKILQSYLARRLFKPLWSLLRRRLGVPALILTRCLEDWENTYTACYPPVSSQTPLDNHPGGPGTLSWGHVTIQNGWDLSMNLLSCVYVCGTSTKSELMLPELDSVYPWVSEIRTLSWGTPQ